jgi:UDP-N-acetylmuramate: L-alanyl-gamma-D-glutamyl-meso-diaminopimelate ligase
LGTHPVFVLEGDEYPSSNEDSRSKFLHYRARDVLLTSASHDHVNVFPTQSDYLKPFQALIAGLPKDGLLVVCQDEPHALALSKDATVRSVTYALNDPSADYCAKNIRYGATTSFDLTARGETVGSFSTQMLGAHNVQNLVGAAAWLIERELLTPAQIGAAFAAFEGVKRRMDRVTSYSRVPAYEGFGSSLDKARSAIEAMRLHFPDRKLAVVFEPHTFSWRSRASTAWYADVFAGCDLVAVLPPPTHGAVPEDQLSQEEIAALIRRTYGSRLSVLTPSLADWGPTVMLGLDDRWTVLALSSGSLGGGLPAFAKALDRKFA